MSFWENETCEYYGGNIIEKHVKLHREIDDKHVLFEEVPAGICTECGVRNFKANVLKQIEERIRNGKVRQLRSEGRDVWFCIIDGQDTARLLKAYGEA